MSRSGAARRPEPQHPVHQYASGVLAGVEPAGPLVRAACERHFRDLETGHERGLYFDEERADHALQWFELLNLEDGSPFVLEPPQIFKTGSLFGWMRRVCPRCGGNIRAAGDAWKCSACAWVGQHDGDPSFRRFRNCYDEEAKGSGKALALDTPIPTPSGWTTMGALRVGDQVFDDRGAVVNVTGAFETMHGHECFEVVFDDSSSIVADADHLWRTERRRSPYETRADAMRGVARGARGTWRIGVHTTAEIAQTLRYANGAYRSANHSIPLAGPLQLEAKAALPIDPYILGVWLGDGDSDAARLTVHDSDRELLDHVAAAGAAVGPRQQSESAARTPRYTIGGTRNGACGQAAAGSLHAVLRRMGLFERKHIPKDYLRSSVGQRLALLQGLLDTDGYISPVNGECEFCSTQPELADGALELVVSLGIKATIRESAAKIYGREVSRRWRIHFHPPPDMPIFRLRRKLQHHIARHARRRLSGDRRIVDVRSVASVPVRCIAVDSASKLFLAGRAMVPTHNTPWGAATLSYMLHADGQASPECYCAASTRDQANTAFRDCVRLVEESPELKECTEVLAHGLYVPENRGILRPVSSEARGLDSKRVHGALIDELHQHRTPEVVDKMRAGVKRQRNALILEITNAGVGRNNVCWAHHEYSERVLSGEIEDDSWFAYVCALDPEDYQDEEGVPSLAKVAANPACWPKANPGLGTILPVSYLEERVREALGMPSRQSEVLRYNFCVWVDAVQIWIPDEIWMGCAVEDPARDLETELLGESCYAGLDLGRSRDLSALVLLFPPAKKRERWAFLEWLWCPEYDIIERSERDQVPYAQWHRDGHVIATPGNVVDFDFIEEHVLDLSIKYNILEWAYDRTFATDLVTRLIKRKFTCVPVGQGSVSMHAPITEIERLVYGKLIEHRGLPPMRWMMGNVSLYKDRHGGLSIDKERAKEKVDGPQALADAMQRAIPATAEEKQRCECANPMPEEAGLCMVCMKWTKDHDIATLL